MTGVSSALDTVARALVNQVLPRLDTRAEASARPFERTDLFLPHHRSRLWGWTHFGVFVPDLPAPWRFLNTMTLIGATGAVCFDNDHLAAPDARNTATVLASTAKGDQHHYAAYDTSTECVFAADGSRLQWGEDLTLEVDLPAVTVRGRYDGFAVDLSLDVTSAASYFVRTAPYDHVSLLAPYFGTITDADGEHHVEGLGTFEYARCVTPQSLSRRALAPALKLPVDFFTYQVIALDQDHQLLLTDVRVAGATACRMAHVRHRDGTARAFTDVTFDVLSYSEDLVDPLGRVMRRPQQLRWSVRDAGRELITITGTTDAPWRFGHGRGYATAYTFTGRWEGRDVAGTGYLEWVDCE